jgi:hypothetical protein
MCAVEFQKAKKSKAQQRFEEWSAVQVAQQRKAKLLA